MSHDGRASRVEARSRGRSLSMVEDRGGQVARQLQSTDGQRLSRRRFFAAFLGGLGLSGCRSVVQVPERQNVSGLVLRLSTPGSVDLNSTTEQTIDISHESGAKPAAAKVVLVDVIQDDAAVDTSALRWAAGYPVYDEAASSDTILRVLVRFAVPTGVPATGRARILFEMPAVVG
jgi:hypothetical protein